MLRLSYRGAMQTIRLKSSAAAPAVTPPAPQQLRISTLSNNVNNSTNPPPWRPASVLDECDILIPMFYISLIDLPCQVLSARSKAYKSSPANVLWPHVDGES